LLPARDLASVKTEGQSLYIYIVFYQVCLRPFAEGRLPVKEHSYPADFGGVNIPAPWTTGKAEFVGYSNFFTPSPSRGEGREGVSLVAALPRCVLCG